MNTRLRTGLCLLLFAIMLPCLVLAAEEAPTVYVIKKGDTLWGLSQRFLNDPTYWPNLWSKNQEVTNPHLIYPGQTVRFIDGRLQIVPAVEAGAGHKAVVAPEEPVPPVEVAEEKTFTVRGNEGRLVEGELKPVGRIIAGQHSRLILGEDDIAFTDIGANMGAVDGQKFSILRKSTTISHPRTSEILGTKFYPLGTLQLTQIDPESSRAIIISSFEEVEPGDWLFPYQEVERREISLKLAARSLKGMIVESYSGHGAVASGDVVYLDLGEAQGVEVGNMFYVVREVAVEKMLVDKVIKQLPHEVIGALVVVETGSRTATALVVKSIDAIFKNDIVVTAPR
jgi:hypothetical protein